MKKENKKHTPIKLPECPPIGTPGESSVPETPGITPAVEQPITNPDNKPNKTISPKELPEIDQEENNAVN